MEELKDILHSTEIWSGRG